MKSVGKFLLFLVLLAAALPAGAQQQTNITGNVKDADGGVLPGVTVTAKNAATALTRTTVTSGEGRFTISGLPPGTYDVTAELQGFATFEVKGLRMLIGMTAPIAAVMKPAGVETTLVVTGERTIVETTESDVSTAISEELIQNLPVAERNAISLALLVPGVSASPYFDPTKSRDNFDGFSFGANSGSENLILVDGADNNDDVVGSILQFYPQDSIQEFEVITSHFKPEYGHTDGGVVNMITKSGTNSLAGGSYWLFRDDSLNKKTFIEEEDGQPKGTFRQNILGGYLGGPVVKDKMFFFGNYDYTKRPQQILPSTGGVLPEVDAQGQLPQDFSQTLALVKVNYNLGKSNFMTGRYAYQDDSTLNVNLAPTDTVEHGGTGANTYHAFLVKDQTVIGSDKLNEAFWQYNTFKNSILSNAVGTPRENKEIIVEGTYSLGHNTNHPQETTQDKHQLVDNFSWRMNWGGDHDIKAGFEYQHVKSGGLFSTGGPFVTFSYNDVDNFLSGGLADNANITNGPIFFVGESTNNIYGGYIQDDWRPTDRLTVNMGFRYDIETNDWTQSSDTSRLGPGRTFITSDPLFLGGQPQTDTNNISPRVGFAYDVEGSGKFVVRGGYGLYYQQIFWNTPLRYPFLEGDLTTSLFFEDGTVDFRPTDPFCDPGQTTGGLGCIPLPAIPSADPSEFVGRTLPGPDPRNDSPFSHQFNAGFSLLLPRDYGLDVDFVHSFSNSQIFRTRVAGRTEVRGLDTHNFGGRSLIDINGAEQSYSGLLLALRKRFDDVSTQVSYTYGVGNGHIARQSTGIINDLDSAFNLNYGHLPGKRDHLFAGSVFYTFPYEFQIGAVLKFQSGFWFTALDSALPIDVDRDGSRADNIADASLGSPGGTGRRGEFKGDTFSQVDLRMSKKFTLASRYHPQVFFEIFNLFNTKNEKVDSVVTNIRADGFGTSRQVAGQPFQGQLSLRLDF